MRFWARASSNTEDYQHLSKVTVAAREMPPSSFLLGYRADPCGQVTKRVERAKISNVGNERAGKQRADTGDVYKTAADLSLPRVFPDARSEPLSFGQASLPQAIGPKGKVLWPPNRKPILQVGQAQRWIDQAHARHRMHCLVQASGQRVARG